jgi:gliding motility-associated-like protein
LRKYKHILIVATVLLVNFSFASNSAYSGIKFIENKGQWTREVLFRAELPNGALFVRNKGLSYVFYDKETVHDLQHGKKINSIGFHSLHVSFVGSKQPQSIEKSMQATEYYNYFVGSNKQNWVSNAKAYQKIVLKQIYPQVDVELLTTPTGIKLNFLVWPGANPNQIKLNYNGADALTINKMGELEIKTSVTTIVEQKPESFQTINGVQQLINTNYVLNQQTVSFSLESYDSDKFLLIDPNIVFGTYIGSVADNFGFAAAYDDDGNAYGAGTVYAANFVATAGAYDITYNGGNGNGDFARDAFLCKFSADGKQLLWCTFLGGSDNEQPHSVTVNAKNEVLVFGTTNSINFPTSTNAYQKVNRGQTDIFICKFNSTGDALLSSTYFGGTNADGVNGAPSSFYNSDAYPLAYNYADWYRGEIITDQFNNVYVATSTQSRPAENLPLINANQSVWGGGFQDGLLIKFNDSLTQVLFSTYLGGAAHDAIYGICFDKVNNLIICGGTNSNNLPAVAGFGARGGIDGFVAKYTPGGTLQRLIYTGTTAYDQNFLVQTDGQNNIYVFGQTAGNITPTFGTFSQPNGKQYLIKYNNNLSNVMAQTVFGQGGNQPELAPSAFLVDDCGRIYISGWGGGSNMSYNGILNNTFGLPVTANAFQRNTDGSDFYLMVMRPDFTGLLYGTYYGGNLSHEHVDGGTSHFDKRGIVYQSVCAGCGGYSDFPTTADAHSRINPGKRPNRPDLGGCNLGMFKFDLRTYINPPEARDTFIALHAGDLLNYRFRATDKDNDVLSVFFFSNLFAKNNGLRVVDTNSFIGEYLATLLWQTTCNDVTGDTLYIRVEIEDNACPQSNLTKVTIKLLVIPAPQPAPFLECLKAIGMDGVTISWNNTITPFFGKYNLLKSKNGSAFGLLDSILDRNTTTYNDNYAINHAYDNFCYKMIAFNNCNLPTDTSRTICSVAQTDTVANPGFTNMNDTLYVLKPFDRLNRLYFFNSESAKDSVYINISGTYISNGKIKLNTIRGPGYAAASFLFEPTCDDINGDTIHLYFTVNNNSCPQARVKTKHVKIVVTPLPKVPAPVLTCPRIINDNTLDLFWDSLKANNYTHTLWLVRVGSNNKNTILSTTELNRKQATDSNAFNFAVTPFCYYLTTSDKCGMFGDTSNTVCTNDERNEPNRVDFYNATVLNNKHIELRWFTAHADSFWRYSLLKSEGRNNNNFVKVADFYNVTDTVFIDENVNVQDKSYCYKIIPFNICGVQPTENKAHCSILLKGNVIPFENRLEWMPYDYWQFGTQRYQILKTEPGLYSNNLFNQVGEKILTAFDNALNFDNGIYDYTIVAIEQNGGNNATSTSNTVRLIQAPVVYPPNAFTPNADGLNETYKTSLAFVKTFNLAIYNRWGEKIFETNDKYQGFNGFYDSKPSQSDVYFYLINYTGFDDSVHTKKGNITLLR